MTHEMSSDRIGAQLKQSLAVLASPAEVQKSHLEQLGTAPSADELALEFEDSFAMVPAAVSSGLLSEQQAIAIRELSDFLDSFSGEGNAALWHVDQLGAWQWAEARRLASAALNLLREPLER